MNPSHPPESPRPRSRLVGAAALVAALGLCAWGFATTSCSRPASVTEKKEEDVKPVDPWEEAGKRLKKETDLAATKAAVAQLNGGLAGRKDLPQPPAPTPDAEKALAALVPLNPADLEEVRAANYTATDAAYLADCFYLRDAARSLDVPNLPPARRAELAFNWVCRQVYLNPWVIDVGPLTGRFVPAVPPTYILRRGSGTGLERAYVLLALLQQMNLDACLIGPPDAGTRPTGHLVTGRDGKPLTGSPKGPFWAVGVRAENDVVLYDPWWSQPLPGPDGKPATLSQVKANPEVLRVWVDSPNPVWGVTRDEVKAASVWLTLPVSAASPRMAFFEERMKAETGLNVAESPAALRDRMQKAVPAGTPVGFWGPPADPFAYPHVLPEFLPIEEGGRDREPPALRRHTLYVFASLPASVIELPRPVPQAVVERLNAAARNDYAAAFLVPPTPRERVQRGQYIDAARFLTTKQEYFARGLERIRQSNPQQLVEWCAKATEVYSNVERARRPGGTGTALPDTDPDVALALAAVEQFWKGDDLVGRVVVDRATARAGLTESSYLLALAMHEQAEWRQLRADAAPADAKARADAAGAWKEAREAWRSYLDQASGLDPFPNRKAHAQSLADRAAKFADAK